LSFRSSWFRLIAVAFCSVRLAGGVHAQELDPVRERFIISLPPAAPAAATSLRSSPAQSMGSPTAFGAQAGDVFAGLVYQLRARYGRRDDGAVIGGFGLGNAHSTAGIELSVTSLSTIRSGFGERVGVGLKVHRVLPMGWGVAMGVENAFEQGLVPMDSEGGLFGVVSRVWGPSSWNPFPGSTTTLGVGNGRFLRERQVATGDGQKAVQPFGSASLRVLPSTALIADWTGQDLSLAASFAPIASFPLVVTPALMDVTGAAGDGVRFAVGVGSGLRLRGSTRGGSR
jgi:hypothetical protein